jgi:hypothetical protein
MFNFNHEEHHSPTPFLTWETFKKFVAMRQIHPSVAPLDVVAQPKHPPKSQVFCQDFLATTDLWPNRAFSSQVLCQNLYYSWKISHVYNYPLILRHLNKFAKSFSNPSKDLGPFYCLMKSGNGNYLGLGLKMMSYHPLNSLTNNISMTNNISRTRATLPKISFHLYLARMNQHLVQLSPVPSSS